MPPNGRRKNTAGDGPAGSGTPPGDEGRDEGLDALVAHCLEAHALIEEYGTPVMRRLIELLLFEIGSEIGEGVRDAREHGEMN